MLPPRALRWLHRIGYFTTLIVALEAAVIGYYSYKNWRFRQAAIEASRAHAGPIAAWLTGYVAESANQLLATLPPLQDLPDGSMRLAVMPSFGQDWFAVALMPRSNGVVATLIVAHRDATTSDGIAGWQAPEHFNVPRDIYGRMIADLDQLVEQWPGEASHWTDGTPLAFERKRAGQVFSGIGNSPSHHAEIAALVRNRLAPYSPIIAALNERWVAETTQ